jgi:hypothetical protein
MAEPLVKTTQTIKKFTRYNDKHRPEVVEFVRTWAKSQTPLAVHEDASIVKVTGSEAQIAGLLADLKAKFNWEPAETSEKK